MEDLLHVKRFGPASVSFNSATAVMPWKTASNGRAPWRGWALQFGHGGDAVEDFDPEGLMRDRVLLQFGHGGDAVEDSSGRSGAPAGVSSFNSATAVMPWKTGRVGSVNPSSRALQFGHGGDAVEDVEQAKQEIRERHALQFGHGGDAVEDGSQGTQHGGVFGASIRPRR